MRNIQSSSSEQVIKEYPHSSFLLEGNTIRAAGNLILTNDRLVFLRQVESLSDKEVADINELTKTKDVSRLLQYAIGLHKKNFQIPLESVVRARLAFISYVPVRTCLQIDYTNASKKVNSLFFKFSLPLFKRILMSEFPTLQWSSAINRALKGKRKSARASR